MQRWGLNEPVHVYVPTFNIYVKERSAWMALTHGRPYLVNTSPRDCNAGDCVYW